MIVIQMPHALTLWGALIAAVTQGSLAMGWIVLVSTCFLHDVFD